MLDSLPEFLRRPLWRAKHAVLGWAANAGHVEYRQHLLAKVLLHPPATHVLDVGANDGQYARLIRRLGFDGTITSFEPVERNIELLRIQAARDPKWRVVPIALGETPGVASIRVSSDTVFSSFLPPSSFGSQAFAGALQPTHEESVEVDSLDARWPALGIPDDAAVHLKIDTQGFERFVLAGAQRVLPRIQSLEVELSFQAIYEGEDHWLDLARTIGNAGFHLCGLFPVSRAARSTIIEADCLFVRRIGNPDARPALQ